MFEGLKGAFSSLIKTISTKELSPEEIEELLDDLELELVSNDVSLEAAVEILDEVREKLLNARVPRIGLGKYVKEILKEAILKRLRVGPDFLELSEKKKPLVIVFFGPNGAGKTTTIAKVAHLFRKHGKMPLIAAADTFRAGAIEQIEYRTRVLPGVRIVKHKYGSSPAAVLYDALQAAKARGYDVVLADTAGRMHTDDNLMRELQKILKVGADLKVLVVDALTGQDGVRIAKTYKKLVNADTSIVTKADADAKGGVIISLGVAGIPVSYLGTGQGLDDLKRFDPKEFVERLFL